MGRNYHKSWVENLTPIEWGIISGFVTMGVIGIVFLFILGAS